MGHDHTGKLPRAQRLTRSEACHALSKLLLSAANVLIEPDKIDTVFRQRWHQLSYLAHSIHEADPQC